MIQEIKFVIADELYLKDPQQTNFGRKLLQNAIEVMLEVGFEQFNFKRLAIQMKSAETSIYRYFENKQKLLMWLNCWYWEWVHYLMDIHTLNIKDAKERLRSAIHELLYATEESNITAYINENLLHKLVVIEGVKSLHFNEVDKANDNGVFKSHKDLISKLTTIISEVNPSFSYSASLASTLTDMAHNQIYYSTHLPRLSSIRGEDKLAQIEQMILQFAFAVLTKK
ncbi:MAG: AcrR family transcriptional regulator [Maribacter sp.]|jgi:AcrR family transcriptional regulator